MTCAQRPAGTDYTVMLDLNSIYVEAMLRIAKKLQAASGGSATLSGGSSVAASLQGASTAGATGGGSGVALGSATPLIESGSGSPGSSLLASRQDHVHPLWITITGTPVVGAVLVATGPHTAQWSTQAVVHVTAYWPMLALCNQLV
jgi:hypothetical protein